MRVSSWLLASLYIVANPVQGYGGSWLNFPASEVPPFQRPVDIVTDIINELGVRILQEYGETRNSGNVAFSPTGIGFVLAALYEGSAGPGNEQIAHVLGLPRDKDITRIGFRDIHRRLRSYLSPDGFLGGLTLNKENTKLRPEYEDILKFFGFDLPSVVDAANATDFSTSLPEAATTSSSSLGMETTESPTTSSTSTQESTSTITSRIGEDTTTTTQVSEEATEISTEAITMKNDLDVTSTPIISDPTTTTKVEEVLEELSPTTTTVSTSTPSSTTTESPTTVTDVSSRLMETSSAMSSVEESTESLSSTQATTIGIILDVFSPVTTESEIPEPTSASAEEETETTEPGSTTSNPEETVSSEITTSVISEPSTTTQSATTVSSEEEVPDAENLGTPEGELVAETSSTSSEDSGEKLTTTTLEYEETSSNEIAEETTMIAVETVNVDEIDEVEATSDSMVTTLETENLLSMEDTKVNAEMTSASSSPTPGRPEKRRVRKIRIKDPVIRTLLDARSADPEVRVKARSELMNSKDNGAVWINRMVEYSFTERNADYSTTLQTIWLKNRDLEDEDSTRSSNSQEILIQGEAKNRGTRSPRGYFSSFPELPSFLVYPDFPEFPEETSWTRKYGGWRVHSKTEEGSEDSTELTFLVNGEVATVVPAATYTVVLPFAFLPNLQALALEFPLDDPRYNILLLLPTDRDGTRRLAKGLGNIGLRELRKELQPAWVRAMIPSFMLKGFVTLTPFLQRLGIRDVFEPRDADLSPMTDEDGVYARDVQQSIGVNIRNYMKPDRTHSRNGLFERAGPVSFVAEYPFLFFIIDAETGVSLITGRIEDPSNSRIL